MNNRRCSRNDPHHPHSFESHAGGETRVFRCPGYLPPRKMTGADLQDLLGEQTLAVKQLTSEALRINLAKGDKEDGRIRVELAKANANSALALAIFLTGGDLEVALSRIAASVERGVTVNHE
jgi:hypothetical protein